MDKNKPLSEIRETFYKESYWNYDQECESAEDVLKDIEKIKSNPRLLGFILKCFAENGLETSPNIDMYYVELEQHHYDTYEPLRELQMKDGTPKAIHRRIMPNYNENGMEIDSIFHSEEEAKKAIPGMKKSYLKYHPSFEDDGVFFHVKPLSEILNFKANGGKPWREKALKEIKDKNSGT